MLFLAVLVSYKIPHDSYSVAQYILKPIKSGNGTFYTSALIPLAFGLIGIIGFINLKRFENRNRTIIFILTLVIILPLMKWSLDFTRTNYNWITHEKLNAVDIENPNISLSANNDKLTITFNFVAENYSRSNNQFKFRVILPETLRECIGEKSYESENTYTAHANRSKLTVNESMVIDLKNDVNQIFDSPWYNQDVIYELYNDSEVVKIIDHGAG